MEKLDWLQIRCKPEDKHNWKRLAHKREMTLSELVRQVMNVEIKKENENESK